MNSVKIAKSIIAILFLMLGIYIFTGINIIETEDTQSRLDEFNDRPFELLSRYLASYDTETHVIEGYEPEKFQSDYFDNLSVDSAVIFRLAQVQIDSELADSILRWVERGGMLIISGLVYGEPEFIASNGLFSELGVRIEWPEDESFLEDNQATSFEIDNGVEISLDLETSYSFSQDFIDKDNDFWSGTETATTIVQKEYGSGYVTIMTEVEIWTNHQLSNVDNVVFADFLLNGKDAVIIFGTADKPHWLVVLGVMTPGTLFFTALLVFLTLWYFAIRFGSPQIVHGRNSSAFILHLQASSNYYWQHDKHQTLIKQLRNQIRKNICTNYLLRSEKDIQLVLPQLSEKTALSEEIIDIALSEGQPASESDYIRLVKQLQIIRNHL